MLFTTTISVVGDVVSNTFVPKLLCSPSPTLQDVTVCTQQFVNMRDLT